MEPISLDTLMERRLDRVAAMILSGGGTAAQAEAAVRARLGGERITNRTIRALLTRARQAMTAGRDLNQLSGSQKPSIGRLPRNTIIPRGEFVYGANVTFRYGRSTSETRYFEVRTTGNATIDDLNLLMKTGSSVMDTLAGSPKNQRGLKYRFGEIEWVAIYRG